MWRCDIDGNLQDDEVKLRGDSFFCDYCGRPVKLMAYDDHGHLHFITAVQAQPA